jgi:hypothetical protein
VIILAENSGYAASLLLPSITTRPLVEKNHNRHRRRIYMKILKRRHTIFPREGDLNHTNAAFSAASSKSS